MSENEREGVPQNLVHKEDSVAETPPLVPAEVTKRVAAALLDGVPTYVISLIPYLGGLLGATYMAIRDALPLNSGPGQSLGKKLFGLRVARMPDGAPCDWGTSILRNLPFILPPLIMTRPGIGWIFGSLVWAAVFVIETLLVIADENGQRIGDRLAKTSVVEA